MYHMLRIIQSLKLILIRAIDCVVYNGKPPLSSYTGIHSTEREGGFIVNVNCVSPFLAIFLTLNDWLTYVINRVIRMM